MFLHQSATKLVHFSRKSVQKITVMADYYHRSVKIADSLLQHIFGTHVKMIRRFVENQEIHRLQQQFYHASRVRSPPLSTFTFLSEASPPNMKAPRISRILRRISLRPRGQSYRIQSGSHPKAVPGSGQNIQSAHYVPV